MISKSLMRIKGQRCNCPQKAEDVDGSVPWAALGFIKGLTCHKGPRRDRVCTSERVSVMRWHLVAQQSPVSPRGLTLPCWQPLEEGEERSRMMGSP